MSPHFRRWRRDGIKFGYGRLPRAGFPKFYTLTEDMGEKKLANISLFKTQKHTFFKGYCDPLVAVLAMLSLHPTINAVLLGVTHPW